MTIKDILIKFQEYQLEFNVLNANCAHNAAANMFMERYGVKNCSIPDVRLSLPDSLKELLNQLDDGSIEINLYGNDGFDQQEKIDGKELLKQWIIDAWKGNEA